MNKIKNIIIIILIVLAGYFFYLNYNKKVSTSGIDKSIAKIDTIYSKATDTIKIIGNEKKIVDVKYVHDTLIEHELLKDTVALKKTFDSVYVKDKIDTSKSLVAYSQLQKTLITNSKFERDSTKLSLTEGQLSICTTETTRLKNVADSSLVVAKKDITDAYAKGKSDGSSIKNYSIVGIAGTCVGILLGVLFAK